MPQIKRLLTVFELLGVRFALSALGQPPRRETPALPVRLQQTQAKQAQRAVNVRGRVVRLLV